MPQERKLALFEAFARIPDPRGRRGRRHPLQAVLAMTTAAILSGCRGVDAISQWGGVNLASHRDLFLQFGFTSFTSPAPSTLHELYKVLNVAAVEQVLRSWVEALLPGRSARLLSVDGKTLRGSSPEPEAPGVHLLSAFVQDPGCTLVQMRVEEQTNEAKAALSLLASLILEGTVIVADAAFCQREFCAQVVSPGGDYLVVVKDNQPALKAAIQEAFETPVPPLRTAVVEGRSA